MNFPSNKTAQGILLTISLCGRGFHLSLGQVILGKLGEGHLVLGLPVPSPYLLHALHLGDDLLLGLRGTTIRGVVVNEPRDHLPSGGLKSRVTCGLGRRDLPPLLGACRVHHHCFDQELGLCVAPLRVHGNRRLAGSRLLEC